MVLRNVPIRRKLMGIILLTCVVVMVVMRAVFFTYEYRTFREALLRQLTMLAEITANSSSAALAFDIPDDARQILSALRAEPHIDAAGLYDLNNNLFAYYPNTPSASLPPKPEPDGYHFGNSKLTIFHPVTQAGKRLGTLYVNLDTGAIMHEFLVGSLGLAALVMAGVLLMAYFLSQALQRRISVPILTLADTAKVVSEKRDYSVRAKKFEQDELGLLTDAFNQMLQQIHEQDQRITQMNQNLEQSVARRTAELQVAIRELESFSYSISHDLRAPLRHVEGFAQLLQKRCNSVIDDTGRHYLTTIIKSTKGLATLIDELLAFSRMGRSELRQSRLDTKTLVDEVMRELQPEAQDRRVDWQIGELPVVEADPAMLRQVWRNLLGNAVKYTRGRDVATIQVAHRMDATDGHVFTVRDNGAGFDMAYADKLFGVFQRLHSPKEFEGTGVGLANVRRIVQRHGGRTWAEGKVGEGALLGFTLPVVNRAA